MTSPSSSYQRTSLGQGEGCECDWNGDANAYDWTGCPIHRDAEQAAYEAWQRHTETWLALCRARGINPFSPEGRVLRG